MRRQKSNKKDISTNSTSINHNGGTFLIHSFNSKHNTTQGLLSLFIIMTVATEMMVAIEQWQ